MSLFGYSDPFHLSSTKKFHNCHYTLLCSVWLQNSSTSIKFGVQCSVMRGESVQSFIPLTCGGCRDRANVVDEVGRVAVTASEVVVPLVALSCCCCRFLCFRCFLRDIFLLSLQSTRTNSENSVGILLLG